MTTEERFIQSDDSHSDHEVARLVRLAGASGPIAAERLAYLLSSVRVQQTKARRVPDLVGKVSI